MIGNSKKIEDAVTVFLFLGLIVSLCIGSIYMFTQPASVIVAQENRLPAELPVLKSNIRSWREAPAQFEKYFTDRLACRTDLVRARNLLLVKAFSVSPSNGVLIGKNDWLYYMLDGDAQTMRHARPFSNEELADWTNALEQRRQWLEHRGIKYCFILAPSKCTVYPEYIPDAYTRIGEKSRCDQLVAYLKEHSQLDVLDLRQFMVSQKPLGQLYYRTDTHWNKFGAMLATSALIDHLRPQLPSLNPSRGAKEFTISTKPVEHGDLVRLMGLDGFLNEEQPVLSREGGEGWKLSHHPPAPSKDPKDAYKPLATQCVPENNKLPKAVLIGDSFSVPLCAYLAPNFSRVYLDRDTHTQRESRFLSNVIKEEKPDVVLQELTERKLMLPAPTNPPEVCEQLSQSKTSPVF
jgi:alginate O-acetyltransferase complex protein AlgJ